MIGSPATGAAFSIQLSTAVCSAHPPTHLCIKYIEPGIPGSLWP